VGVCLTGFHDAGGQCSAIEVFEVLETSLANPIVVVLRGVALMEGVRRLFFRKFGPAEFAEVKSSTAGLALSELFWSKR